MAESIEDRRACILPGHPALTIAQQCALLDLPRASYYYRASPIPEETLLTMRKIDALYMEYPFLGSRRIAAVLGLNRKLVQRLMRLMGIYLLRGVAIARRHQVWSADITCVPIAHGFLYLVAVMDWYSRFVLSWRLSNTLDSHFCRVALEDALRAGTPEIWNSDQGAQFTSAAFLAPLKERQRASDAVRRPPVNPEEAGSPRAARWRCIINIRHSRDTANRDRRVGPVLFGGMQLLRRKSGVDHQFSQRVEELFQSAWDLPIAERNAYLETAAAGDEELLAAVRRLIDADAQAESGGQWSGAAATLIEGETTFERFRLLERIGAGGMAVVHKAVRADDEFSKLVAIKQILIPDAAAVERFRRERQMLAGLEHPNIVRMLDGGTGPDGAPFLVMEYVDGVPIDRFVRERKLAAGQIVALFRKVCGAVGYAHRNLIIHRDLKPGNILVTEEGEPKVLDFGVAKAMDATTLTLTGMAAMTPGFASPEQVRGGPISTATDIYSLGVLLYNLLTGGRPYRTTESSIELAKAICEEPPLPMQGIDGDLETIVQMALRKEPERRYSTVEQLSEDLGRYLDGYPVAARPDTPAYRARKFIGRNKAGMTAAALVLVTLAGGIVATSRQAQIANRRFNQLRSLARYFVFDVHDGIRDLPGSTAVRKKIVEKGLDYLDVLAGEQGNDQDLQREIASAYEQIAGAQGGFRTNTNEDNGAAALGSYRKAVAIREALVRANPRSAQDQRQLASVYSGMGSIQAQSLGDLKSGVESLQKGVAAAERAVSLDEADKSGRNILADAYLMLGDATGNPSYQNLGDVEGAQALYEKALALREPLFASDPKSGERQRNLAMAENRLGMILNAKSDYERAFPHLQRVRQIDEAILAAAPNDSAMRINTASANRNLALVAFRCSHRAEALGFARRSRELNEQISRENPNDRGARLTVAGSFYAEGFVMGDEAKAMPLYERSIEMYRALHRERPEEAVPVGMRTALLYRARAGLQLARLDAASGSIHELLTVAGELLAKDPANATARSNRLAAYVLLGKVCERQHDTARAAAAYRSALEDYRSLQAAAKSAPRDEQEIKSAQEALARL